MQDVPVLERVEGPIRLDEQALTELKASLRGSIVRSGDDAYDSARKVWNGMIDRHPAMIVRAVGAADVIAAVNFARAHALPVSVRGGGHNVTGSAVHDDALVIDLSSMRSVRVDPQRQLVRVEGGAKLGDVDHETQAFGLAVPLGLQSLTGVAGLSLHGGLGFLTRTYGLSADNLIAADVVTADGQLILADAEHHSDLLWALRGGGSVGVVTSFEFQLHPVGPEVWLGMVLYPVAQAKQVLQFIRAKMADAPDELMAISIFWTAASEEYIPEEYRGAPVIVVVAFWAGSLDEGERAIQPFRELGTPIADLSGPLPFVAAQKLFDADYPNGRRYYWKSIYLENLDDAVIAMLAEHAAERPSQLSSVDIWALGGAMARVTPEQGAFFRRDAPFLIGIEANWDEPAHDAANIAWARNLYRDAERFSRGGTYLNFPGMHEEGEDLYKKTFGANYERLREVQRKYDPEGLFRFNVRTRHEARNQ
jgi:FAD/FMN-containing dehydrogenase